MSKLFSHNAYSVLGLDTSASQKEISRRSKEIINLLRIDESPEYETDIPTINKMGRSEASVNDAVQRLGSPIKRIKEYFFWFEIENDKDEKVISLLQDNQYDEALSRWKARSEKSFTAKRNLAIASSLLLNHTGYKKYLKVSVDAWQDVVKSDRFWSHFDKVYALNDEVGTSKSAIDAFREKVLDHLSDFYTDVSRQTKDKTVYAAFSAAFRAKGQKVQEEVLAPIFEQISNASDQLRKLNVSEDNILSPQEIMTIRRLVKKIQGLFQEIKDLGLYEDSHSKVMRDKAAEAINIVAVDIFNNLDEDTKAGALVKIAKSLAVGPAVISQIEKNVHTMSKVSSQGKIIKPINDLIENEQYAKALDLINKEQDKHKNDPILQGYFQKRIQWCVVSSATEDFTEAKRLFDAEDFEGAESLFAGIYDFIYSYVGDFDIDKSSVDTVQESLKAKLMVLNASNLEDIDAYRESVIKKASAIFKDEDKFELPVLILLLDSAIYQRLSQVSPEMKKSRVKITPPLFTLNGCGTIIYGDTLYLALLFFPLLPLASYDLKQKESGHYVFYGKKPLATWKMWWKWGLLLVVAICIIAGSSSDSSSSNSTSSTPAPISSSSSDSSAHDAWQACSDEYDSLKSQLESTNSEMDSDQASGDTEAYNDLVSQQNSLVQQVHDKATECNNLR